MWLIFKFINANHEYYLAVNTTSYKNDKVCPLWNSVTHVIGETNHIVNGFKNFFLYTMEVLPGTGIETNNL